MADDETTKDDAGTPPAETTKADAGTPPAKASRARKPKAQDDAPKIPGDVTKRGIWPGGI